MCLSCQRYASSGIVRYSSTQRSWLQDPGGPAGRQGAAQHLCAAVDADPFLSAFAQHMCSQEPAPVDCTPGTRGSGRGMPVGELFSVF